MLWRLARGLVRAGERRSAKAERLAAFVRAESLAARAVALSSASVDALYWHGVALGKQGQAKGLMRSLRAVGPIRARMEAVLHLAPCHAPARHVLGEMLWQLPAMLGGSKAGARRELEAAVACDPSYTAPYATLAEAYLDAGMRSEARALAGKLAAVTRPADPADAPGNRAELERVLGQSAE